MSKFIKWTGPTTRKNTFGDFKPGVVTEVPDHVAQALLTVSRFRLVASEDVIPENFTVDQLRESLRVAHAEIELILQANAELESALTRAQQQLDEYQETVGSLDGGIPATNATNEVDTPNEENEEVHN